MPLVIQSPRSTWRRSVWTVFAIATPLAFLITAACSDSTSTSATTAMYITPQAGDSQTVMVESMLPDSLEVLVTDASNIPVPGATVTWSASTFGGLPNVTSSVTNDSGFARVAWTLGAQADTDTMTASISTNIGTEKALFVAFATPGPAVAVTAVSAQTATGPAGVTIVPLQVLVIDQYDNPVPNATVAWSLAGAGSLSNSTTTTDPSGKAAVNWTLGVGNATVTASITVSGGSTAPVIFTATGS